MKGLTFHVPENETRSDLINHTEFVLKQMFQFQLCNYVPPSIITITTCRGEGKSVKPQIENEHCLTKQLYEYNIGSAQ